MKSVLELADDELEDCIDGSASLEMIREILAKPNVVVDNEIDMDKFAEWFAYGSEGYIGAELETEEWTEANDNNLDWGADIANTINDFVQGYEC